MEAMYTWYYLVRGINGNNIAWQFWHTRRHLWTVYVDDWFHQESLSNERQHADYKISNNQPILNNVVYYQYLCNNNCNSHQNTCSEPHSKVLKIKEVYLKILANTIAQYTIK